MSRELVALCIAVAVNFLSHTMTRPLVSLYAAELGAGPVAIGAVGAAFAFLPLFAAVPAGALTDRLGGRTLVLWGSFGCAVASAIAGLRPSLALLVASQVLMGMAQLAVVVASQTMAGSAEAGKAREVALGWLTTANSLGQLAGPLAGGLAADATSYGAAFVIAGAVGLAAPLAALALPKQAGRVEAARLSRSGGVVRRLLRHGGVKAGILSSFAVLFTVGVRQTFFPLYVQGLGYSATAVGALLSVYALASVLVRPFMPAIVRAGGGRFPVLFGSLCLLAAGLAFVPYSHSLTALGVTSVLVGIGVGLCQPLSMLTVADSVPHETRGLAMGVRLTGNRLAQLVNPLFFGAVTSFWGLGVAFLLGGLLLLSTAAYLFRWREHFCTAHSMASRGEPYS